MSISYINEIPMHIEPKTTSGEHGPLETKQLTITTNGIKNIQPNPGYDGFSQLTLDINVQPILQQKSVTVPIGTSLEIYPDSGYDGLSKVIITTPSVPPVPITLETQNKTVTSNGNYSYEPSMQFDGIGRLNLSVRVPTGGTGNHYIQPRIVIAIYAVFFANNPYLDYVLSKAYYKTFEINHTNNWPTLNRTGNRDNVVYTTQQNGFNYTIKEGDFQSHLQVYKTDNTDTRWTNIVDLDYTYVGTTISMLIPELLLDFRTTASKAAYQDHFDLNWYKGSAEVNIYSQQFLVCDDRSSMYPDHSREISFPLTGQMFDNETYGTMLLIHGYNQDGIGVGTSWCYTNELY